VVVLIDTATGWGRNIIRGIASYGQQHGPWHLWLEPHGAAETLRPPPNWVGDGIIARVSTAAMARQLRRYGVPVVNVSGIHLPGKPLPTVTTDLAATAEMAAQYFLEWGFRSFGYVGWKSFAHVREHYETFSSAIKRAGYGCPSFALGDRNSSAAGWQQQQQDLARWLGALPQPAAIFCWSRQGLAVLDACALGKLNVPNQIAVLTGDDDELLYSVCTPSLSGIAQPGQQVGRMAAETLGRLMAGEKPELLDHRVKPTHVAVRVSTDTLAVNDPEVAEAIRYIRDRGTSGIQIGDIAEHVAMSRRSLERRFLQALGRSPADELRRVRLRKALMLLTTSSLSIPRIAEESGFSSGIYLAQVVRQGTGMTPRDYRNANRVAAMS
jgi:LacI family transcriptional regulator